MSSSRLRAADSAISRALAAPTAAPTKKEVVQTRLAATLTSLFKDMAPLKAQQARLESKGTKRTPEQSARLAILNVKIAGLSRTILDVKIGAAKAIGNDSSAGIRRPSSARLETRALVAHFKGTFKAKFGRSYDTLVNNKSERNKLLADPARRRKCLIGCKNMITQFKMSAPKGPERDAFLADLRNMKAFLDPYPRRR